MGRWVWREVEVEMDREGYLGSNRPPIDIVCLVPIRHLWLSIDIFEEARKEGEEVLRGEKRRDVEDASAKK